MSEPPTVPSVPEERGAQPATVQKPKASRLQIFGVLALGGGLSLWLVGLAFGWVVPVQPLLAGVGVAMITVDWLIKNG